MIASPEPTVPGMQAATSLPDGRVALARPILARRDLRPADKVVLLAVAAAADTGAQHLTVKAIATTCGMRTDDVSVALFRLEKRGLVRFSVRSEFGEQVLELLDRAQARGALTGR